jgi:hypothetical protein
MFLPCLTLTVAYLGEYALIMRSSVVDVMREDYLTLARAKGLRDVQVRNRHAVRNALLPSTALIAINFGFVISGAITVETVFSWPGLGLLTYDALRGPDLPMLQGLFLVFSAAVILFNLARPRTRSRPRCGTRVLAWTRRKRFSGLVRYRRTARDAGPVVLGVFVVRCFRPVRTRRQRGQHDRPAGHHRPLAARHRQFGRPIWDQPSALGDLLVGIAATLIAIVHKRSASGGFSEAGRRGPPAHQKGSSSSRSSAACARRDPRPRSGTSFRDRHLVADDCGADSCAGLIKQRLYEAGRWEDRVHIMGRHILPNVIRSSLRMRRSPVPIAIPETHSPRARDQVDLVGAMLGEAFSRRAHARRGGGTCRRAA